MWRGTLSTLHLPLPFLYMYVHVCEHIGTRVETRGHLSCSSSGMLSPCFLRQESSTGLESTKEAWLVSRQEATCPCFLLLGFQELTTTPSFLIFLVKICDQKQESKGIAK